MTQATTKRLKIYQVQIDLTMLATSMSFLFLICVLAAVNSQIGLIFSPEEPITYCVATCNHRLPQIFKAFSFHNKPKNDKLFVF
jgi:hypothetical protein